MAQAQSGEEETIANIANFLESTKPVQKVPDNISLTKVNDESPRDESSIASRQSHKLPVGVMITRPAQPQKRSSSISINKMSGFAGISISKMPINSAREEVLQNTSQSKVNKSPLLSSSISINKVGEQQSQTGQHPILPSKSPPKTTSTESFAAADTVIQEEQPKPTQNSTPSSDPLQKSSDLKSSESVFRGSVTVNELLKLTEKLNSDDEVSSLVLRFMSEDSLRNLCDGVTALQLSGENVCTDLDTLSLYQTALNIIALSSDLDKLSTEEFQPLTNLSVKTSFCSDLLKLVYKEPNLKGHVNGKLGESEITKYEQLINKHTSEGFVFIKTDIRETLTMYHKLRNIALKYVLTKLRNVYMKMKPMFAAMNIPDEEFKMSVSRLANLVTADWGKEVQISEETGYDFNFLITIMKHVKKSKEGPKPVTSIESQSALSGKENPTDTTNREKETVASQPSSSTISTKILSKESFQDVVQPPQLPRPKVSTLPGNITLSSVSIQKVSPIKSKEINDTELQGNSNPPCQMPEPQAAATNGVMIRKVSSKDPIAGMRQLEASQNTVSIAITQEKRIESPQDLLFTPKSCISVDTLHSLKDFLENSKEPQERVIRGVGEQAFREFCNLVSTLEDRTLVIEDINIRTLYYTILNFARCPVTPEMKKYDPLSNFALKLQNFIDLRNLFRKDQNIAKIVAENLEADELDNFDRHVESLLTREKDFVQRNQEMNIIIYHKIRNCLIDVTMSRLMVVHSKISSLDTSSAPGIFVDSVKMLSSLMATHYNGQVLMMEKIKFNFDFLTTILDFLKKLNPKQGDVNIKNVSTLKKHDPVQIMIDNLCQEVSDPTTFQSLENILSQKLSRAWLTTIKSITDTGNMTMVQKRGVYSIKNAVFLYKNNLRCHDVPLTNISLEVSKILSLSRFISRDAGIKEYIGKKFGEVAPKELEALVAAHTERGDEFILKFVEKNINLYHSLRNSALEKILKQITLVHSKFKNREVPEAAKNSSQYHAAIKRLEDIVTADTVTKMIIIEEQKFDFDFLSTILLVWKTENARLAEAAASAARAALPAPVPTVPSPISTPVPVQSQKVPGRQLMLQSNVRTDEEDVDDPSPADVISIEDDQDMTPVPRKAWPGSSKTVANEVTPRMSRPVATVTPQTRMNTSGDLVRMQGGMKSMVKVATVANPMQVIDGQGELPIRSKCTLCNDRSSENMLQFVHHYALMHFREDIGKYVKTDVCPCCSQKFEDRNELIKHVGLVHGAVNLILTKTERWICDFCKKEFLTEEFLKKHLIKGHLERKFEQTFLALSENNEILCQFCDTTFTVKKNLFCHIGIDHNKLEELLPNNKKDDQDSIKCRHCELETGLQSLKSHYIKTHYRDTFQKFCQELKVLTDDHSCKYCLVEFSEDEGLLEHLGLEHNLIYSLIANFQAKNVSAEFTECPKLKSMSELAELKSSRQADPSQDQGQDPLLTETVFVDTSKASSPVKPIIRIVSPSKLKSRQTKQEEVVRKIIIQPPPPPRQVVKQKVSLPSHPVFEEYKAFCSNLTNDQEARLIMKSSFIKFSLNIFIQFLDKQCLLKANIGELETTLCLFETTYPEVKLKTDPAILKFLALREYTKYCENLKTTPEVCNPMHIVIFLSQLIAKPGFQPNQPGLEWLVRKISSHHDKIDNKALLESKKITDFFDAVGMKLAVPEEEEENETESLEELTVRTPSPKVVSPLKTAKKQSEKIHTKPVIEADNESQSSSAPAPKELTPSPTQMPSVDKDIVADEKSEPEPEVKTEKCEQSDKSDKQVTLSEEPEVIELGDDDESVEYRYYCLECEGCPGAGCDHTQHPRRPIPYDIRPHFQKTGHVGVSPMEKFLEMKPMNDVAYSFNHGASVRKQWKDLVLSGSYKPLPYSGVKLCKWKNCTETFVDAVDALKHIKDTHLKLTLKKAKVGVNASVKRKSDVTPGNLCKSSRS